MKPRLRILGSRFIYAIKLKRLMLILTVFVFCVTNIAVTVMVQKTLLPLVSAYALTSAKREATQNIYNAIEQTITSKNITYGDLYNIVRNNNGAITSIEINTAGANLFKTDLAKAVKNSLDNKQISIPLGNVFNNLFLIGRGPKIPIRLNTFGFTTAEISGQFVSGGINQTKHSVFITVETEVSVVLPYKVQSVKVKSQVPVVETVIVGNVPSLYPFSAEH